MKLLELVLWPAALLFLLAVPLVWTLFHASERARARRLERLVGPRAPVLAGNASSRRRRLRATLSLGGFALAILAAVQPAWGIDPEKVQSRGVDVLVCLDVSRSMLARDLEPSRLGRARDEIRALANRVQGDRLGLVAFAGDARLRVPLTRDMESFTELVGACDPSSVELGGTDLGAALESALAALEAGEASAAGSETAILLITDGEDLEGRGLAAAQACRDAGAVVHCVGLGSALGSKIAVERDGDQAFLRDRAGAEVVTRLDARGLEAIAAATGGSYLDLGATSRPLVELYEARILPMAGKAASGDRSALRNHYQWPLGLAFLLFLAEFAVSERRIRR